MANDGIPIPASRRAFCTYCGLLVDSAAVGVWQRATGWVENRRQGGSNAIALPNKDTVYACGICIDRLRHNISPDQRTLFESGLNDGR